MRMSLLGAGLALLLACFASESNAAEECWLYPPSGYQKIGGGSKLGPYSDWYAANRVNNEYFNGQGTIQCRTIDDGGGRRSSGEFNYGAAKFHNRTNGTISFSVRRQPGGSWQAVTVKSGAWHWWWQECPCRFHCTWDSSFEAGYQSRTREVYWYGYGTKPAESDARNWQFVQRGQRIDLIPGSTEAIPAAKQPARSATTVSLVGRGSGTADEDSFRKSKSASGTFQLQFMPRVNGTIPTVDGQWQMQWRRIIGNREDLNRKEVWSLSGSGFYGTGGKRQAIEVVMQGGAGTGSYWSTKVPGHPDAGLVKMKVHVQFSGGNVTLSFTKAF
ncbi:MAG: hypothetical protein O2894_05885 [Planctomycetota bacterium]|nr:hypothetical protein [Planctomycetota bacterium]